MFNRFFPLCVYFVLFCQFSSFPLNKKWKKNIIIGTSPWEYIPIYNSIHYYLHSNGSLQIKSATHQQSGQYICQSTNGYGTDIGKLIHLKINGKCCCPFLPIKFIKFHFIFQKKSRRTTKISNNNTTTISTKRSSNTINMSTGRWSSNTYGMVSIKWYQSNARFIRFIIINKTWQSWQ